MFLAVLLDLRPHVRAPRLSPFRQYKPFSGPVLRRRMVTIRQGWERIVTKSSKSGVPMEAGVWLTLPPAEPEARDGTRSSTSAVSAYVSRAIK